MSFENAREYLARVVPWPQPGEPGFVNLHWTFPPTTARPDGKAAWTGRAVRDASEAARTLEFALKPGSNTLDVYACMSSQLEAVPKVTKGARPFSYNAPLRLATNAISLKSFFIDVDFGKTKKDPASGLMVPDGYQTAEEAIVAMMAFVSKVGLPKPTMVVNSGGGFHFYWCVNSALTPPEWLPIAFALAEATKAFGLHCDTQCTVDSVRVLRIPDTLNRKQEPARHVRFVGPRLDFDYNLDRISTPLLPYMGKVHSPAAGAGVDRNIFPLRAYAAGVSELAMGLDSLWPSPDLDHVALACGFVRDALATGGAALSNPLWNITTLISTFTKGGRADAHRMGNKHADYTKESTDDFFERKDRERLDRGLGWPSCATISATGGTACRSCALFAQGKSPLNHEQRPAAGPSAAAQALAAGAGATAAPAIPVQPSAAGGFGAASTSAPINYTTAPGHAPVVTPPGNISADLPSGYTRDANGIVSRIVPDPANPMNQLIIPISDYPLMNAWLQNEPRMLHFDSVVDRNRVGQISIELECLATTEMRKVLQRQGFMLKANDKTAGDFFVSWVQKLQQMKDSVASAPFGWQDKNGQTEGFIFGGQLWTPNGASPSASANPVLNQQYKPKGSDAYWLDAVKLVTLQGRPDLEAIVASAFAAPLVMFTGHLGMLMSAYSKESGIGKSTALRIAQAVWGDPIRAVQSLSDTQNSVMRKIGEVRSLPVYWDELKTDEDTKKFVNMTFQIAQGKEKSRLNQHAQMKEPGHWQTLVVSASNDSLIDHVTQQTQTTLAGLYRIFEYTVKPSSALVAGRVDTSEATIRLSKLNNNYGSVGLKYASWLGTNFAQCEVDMATLSKQLNIEVGAQQEERFWVSLVATILLGARYANALGYAVFDEPGLKTFMLASLENMRKLRGQQTVDLTRSINVSSIMAQFLKDMQAANKVIYTDRIHIAPGRPPAPNTANAVKILRPSDVSRLNGVAVQIGLNDKLMRISSTAFGEWLKKAGKSRHLLMEALHASMTTTSVVGFLGGGTGLAFAKENILQIDLSSSNDLNFVDEN